ncbi:hypothetical protein, partial [Halorubrum sp. Atlit-28R]|uniref:hypothetical protein n=1 Tax=Halorubrum sp. Atlit-28R TaxID=2282129 RepID=UPI001F187027
MRAVDYVYCNECNAFAILSVDWGLKPGVEDVTSFTIIYHCINIQHHAKRRAGAACGGSNQCAYQPPPVLTGFACPY